MVAVEEAIRSQSLTRLWYTYRAGRITASRMKQACHTDTALPSQSLIKYICYPEAYQFTTKATLWGCTHELEAREHYANLRKKSHQNISVVISGFVINLKWPHFGASPDGIVKCECCGKGVLKVKCPYCDHDKSIEDIAVRKQSCLTRGEAGLLKLNRSHAYYYQVQTQMFVCNVAYCDFCVCTFLDDTSSPSMYIENLSKH